MNKVIIKLYFIRLKRGRPSNVNGELIRMNLPSNNHNNGANNKKRKQEIQMNHRMLLLDPREKGITMKDKKYKCAHCQKGLRQKATVMNLIIALGNHNEHV